MKNIGDRSTEKWQTAQSAATASTGDDTCRAAKSMTLQQQASKRFEEFLSTLQRHWRKAKMAFEDIQTTPTDLPTDAYIAEADGVGTVEGMGGWRGGGDTPGGGSAPDTHGQRGILPYHLPI
ncbi:hypothetical protein CYMTET_19473 [Cymbomonas tetramitiformis]|uniref:Uncharacterized protein n=1 Tax=Cymbomonas tetramitiformis TaxID=36881 RepID=A0AAE0G617_9CHLO|nr:hypothetical protein CYMTET_19473 [Cymbomonas tetramitiformis]